MPINPDSVISRAAGLMSTHLGPEMILLNSEKGIYVGLDEIGRRVWDLLMIPCNVKDLSAKIANQYQGDSLQITADLVAFLDELITDGIICITEASSVATG